MNRKHFVLFLGIIIFLTDGATSEEWRNEVKRSAQNLSLNVEKFVEKVLGVQNLQVR